jgi:Kef-type K+ transport system membrane component KefB
MHAGHQELISLLILLSGSVAMPIFSGWLRIPSAVLLIGFGILFGPHVLAWLGHTSTVAFLYEVGFILLMFLAGMEIDFNRIRSRGLRPLGVMTAICVVIFGLAFLAAWLLSQHPIYGLALGAISVGMPLVVLKESGGLRSQLGQAVILLGSVGEFLTVVGMTLFYFTVNYGLSWELLWGLSKLIGLLLVAAISLRILAAMAWWRPGRFSKLVDPHDGSEIGVRAALLLAIAFSTLAAVAGVEAIVGAFVAGALIAFVLRGKEVLEEKLTVVGHGLFIPIFFVVVGMRFDTASITWPNLSLAGILLVITFAVRLLPGLALVRLGLSLRETLGAVSLLSAPLTLVVAIAAIGGGLGVLDAGGRGTLIVLAVASGVIFPIVFRLGSNAEKTIAQDPESVAAASRGDG